MDDRPPTSRALAIALAVVTVGAAASAQPLPPPALALLREAVARAPEGTPLQVLARGALVRRGRAIFRVRVRGEGWEGWTFLPATAVPAGCP